MTNVGASLPTRPEWGHPLLTPEGLEIRVPGFAMEKLRRLGLLVGNRAVLSPMVYELLDPQYDCLTEGLRRLLGPDLSGPAWLVCRCRECSRRESETDHTPLPGRNPLDEFAAEAIVREVQLRRRRAA